MTIENRYFFTNWDVMPKQRALDREEMLAGLRREQGPVSKEMAWLRVIAKEFSGKGQILRLAIALVLQFQQFGQSLVVHRRMLERLGIHRSTAYRALEDLQKAGLISVSRRHKHAPSVRIIWRSDRERYLR